MYAQPLERLVKFSGSIIRFLKSAKKGPFFRLVADQLLRCSTAIGANYEAATGAESTADFIHKMQVSLKEAREACYWLKVFVEGEIVDGAAIEGLLDEAIQIRLPKF